MVKLYVTDSYYNVFNVVSDLIKDSVNTLKGKNLIFCEEKVSLMAERVICSRYGGSFNTEVYSFGNFLRLNKQIDGVLSKEGSSMVVKRVLSNLSLNCFKSSKSSLAPSLYDLIIQLKSASVTPSDLLDATQKTSGVLKNKLTDVAKVFIEYQKYLEDNGFDDQSSMLDYLPQVFLDTPDLAQTDVYLVGFSSFTKQTRQAIKTLLNRAKSVTAVLVEGENSYAYVNESAEIFKNLVKEEGQNIYVERLSSTWSTEGKIIADNLFNPLKNPKAIKTDKVYSLVATGIYEEAERIACTIKGEVMQGKIRYKDVSVALADATVYKDALKRAFDLLDVPYFFDEKKKAENHPLVTLILSYIELFRRGLEPDQVKIFVKNPLFCDDKSLTDAFEKYLTKYNLFYSSFKSPFEYPAQTEDELSAFNTLREKALSLLSKFNIKGLIESLDVKTKLEEISARLESVGERVESAVNAQIYGAISKILGEIDSILNGVKLSYSELKKVFLSGVSALELSIIPQYNDAVFVGGYKEVSLYPAKYLFAPGLTVDVPNCKDDVALLADGDIDALANIKVMIEPKIKVVNHRLRENVALGLGAFTDKLFISYPLTAKDGNKNVKGEVYNFICDAFTTQDFPTIDGYYTSKQAKMTFSKACSDFYEGKINDFSEPSSYYGLFEDKNELLGFAQRSGKQIKIKLDKNQSAVIRNVTSPTSIEEYYNCPYKSFLSHGLKLQQSDDGAPNASSYGTLMHAVFAEYVYNIHLVTDEKSSNELVDKLCIEILKKDEYKRFLHDDGFSSDVERALNECKKFCYKTFVEKTQSKFSTSKTNVEVPFGRTKQDKNAYPPVMLLDGKVKLSGVIDRVDTYGDYFRVIDYKTGSADASTKNLFNGKKLQLYLYASAIKTADPNKKIAGLYYLPVDDQFVAVDKKQKSLFIGKTLEDKQLIESQDATLINGKSGEYIPVDISEKGYKGVSSAENLQAMVDYALKLSENAVEQMADGVIVASPYEKVCSYCPYVALCGRDFEQKARVVNSVKEDSFYKALYEQQGGDQKEKNNEGGEDNA